MKIKYIETDHSQLGLIKPLWERLRDHHASISRCFSEQILKNTFQERSRNLLLKAKQGQLNLILAYDEISDRLVGFCVSSITKENLGELDSIYVLDDYRSNGIGDTLMKLTLDWFKKLNADNISISVSFGNESALLFYEKYGFYPRTYLLKNRVNNSGD